MTDTKALGVCVINGREVLLSFTTTDGTAKEATFADLTLALKNLRDHYAGQVMTSFWLQVATPSDLDLVQLKDSNGAIQFEFQGSINAALGVNPQMVTGPIAWKIEKGSSFLVTTSD